MIALGDVLEIKYGKDHKKLGDGAIPCYGSGGVMRYVSEHLYDDESILIPRKGSLNNIFYMNEPFWTVDTLFWSKIDKDLADPKFIYYQLKLIDFNRLNEGSAVPSMTVPILNNIKIKLPTIKIQKEVSKVLTDLDRKIELNRQTNQTIEQMAQALFKSWFVDFDPVFDNALAAGNDIPKALQHKAEQRKQAQKLPDFKPLPDDIRSLFPSEFEQMGDPNIGIAGWIPQGWNFDSFSNIATLKTLSVHPNRDPDKTWTHFSLPAFDSGKSPTQDIGIEIKSGKYRVSDSIVLVSKLNPNTPRVWLPNVVDTESSVCSTEFMPFEPLDKSHRAYIYSLMCSDRVQSEIASRVTGTTGSHQRVSPKNIAILPIILPSEVCINLYCQMVKDFFSKVESNIEQNAELDKLRDILLPKLISGELMLNN